MVILNNIKGKLHSKTLTTILGPSGNILNNQKVQEKQH